MVAPIRCESSSYEGVVVSGESDAKRSTTRLNTWEANHSISGPRCIIDPTSLTQAPMALLKVVGIPAPTAVGIRRARDVVRELTIDPPAPYSRRATNACWRR